MALSAFLYTLEAIAASEEAAFYSAYDQSCCGIKWALLKQTNLSFYSLEKEKVATTLRANRHCCHDDLVLKAFSVRVRSFVRSLAPSFLRLSSPRTFSPFGAVRRFLLISLLPRRLCRRHRLLPSLSPVPPLSQRHPVTKCFTERYYFGLRVR